MLGNLGDDVLSKITLKSGVGTIVETAETAPEVRAVHVVAQQLVAAHVALRGEPVQRGRARPKTDSSSKALALICMLYQRARGGMELPKAPKCSFAIPPGGTEKSRRAVLQTPCEAVPRKVSVTPT